MKHKRNTEGIKAAAQRKRQEALKRANLAIAQLKKAKKPINFNTIAEAAKVSKSWLYEETALREEIESLREKGASKRRSSVSPATKASQNVIVRTLRKRNSELRQRIKNLEDNLEIVYGSLVATEEERDRLEAQLAVERAKLKQDADSYSFSSKKNDSRQEEGLIEQIQDLCDSKLSPDFIELVQISSPDKVENAVAALKARSDVKSPIGYLRKAIEEGWEPPKPSMKHDDKVLSLPAGFKRWYEQAILDAFLQDVPINELGTVSGELQVRVNREGDFGAPYTLMSWKQAKLEWEKSR